MGSNTHIKRTRIHTPDSFIWKYVLYSMVNTKTGKCPLSNNQHPLLSEIFHPTMEDTDFLVKWTICTNKLLGCVISTFAFKLESQTHKHTHIHIHTPAHIQVCPLEALSPFPSAILCVCVSTIFHSHFNYIMCANKGKVKFYSRRRWKSSEWEREMKQMKPWLRHTDPCKMIASHAQAHTHTHTFQIFVFLLKQK